MADVREIMLFLYTERPGCYPKPKPGYLAMSGSKVHDKESYPAAHYSDRRIGAHEHQRYKLVVFAKNEAVNKRTVEDQWSRNRNVEEGEAVQQEYTRP